MINFHSLSKNFICEFMRDWIVLKELIIFDLALSKKYRKINNEILKAPSFIINRRYICNRELFFVAEKEIKFKRIILSFRDPEDLVMINSHPNYYINNVVPLLNNMSQNLYSNIRELRMVYNPKFIHYLFRMSSLEKIEFLRGDRYNLDVNSQNFLPNLAKNCTKLENLSISGELNLNSNPFCMESVKYLKIDRNLPHSIIGDSFPNLISISIELGYYSSDNDVIDIFKKCKFLEEIDFINYSHGKSSVNIIFWAISEYCENLKVLEFNLLCQANWLYMILEKCKKLEKVIGVGLYKYNFDGIKSRYPNVKFIQM